LHGNGMVRQGMGEVVGNGGLSFSFCLPQRSLPGGQPMMRATATPDEDYYDDEEDEDDAQAAMLAELEALEELGRPAVCVP
jgi:hypothetical protein